MFSLSGMKDYAKSAAKGAVALANDKLDELAQASGAVSDGDEQVSE